MAAKSEVLPVMRTILLCYVLVAPILSTKLNLPKVLLPYYTTAASNYTLEVSDGCYRWRSTRPEIATVVPVKDEDHSAVLDPDACSSDAVVTAVSKTATRLTAVIIAEDTVSGQQLRCDVIVDVIHDLFIETTTRELYLEDSPEQFMVRAQDDEGNVFTSLHGTAFEWSLISDTDMDQESIVDAHNVLRILPFSESAYETPPYIEALERVGKQGDTLLVEGIRTGSAKVSVRLKDAVYKHIKECQVRLIVIANIELNPPVVYLMVSAKVFYKVQLRKQGKMTDIPMPSQQYYLELETPEIGDLDTETSSVTARQLGNTDIVLKDRNIKVKEAFHQPSAGIYVTTPGYLAFVCLPGRKWVLETGRKYEIIIEVYDKDNHRLHAADNMRIIGQLPEEYFKIHTQTENGTHYYVTTLQKGNTLLRGQLSGVITEDGTLFEFKPVIRTVQDVEIYDPIEVIPKVVVFPWNPSQGAVYTYQLQAIGGSGNYTWSSSNNNIVAVNVRGMITTSAVGNAVITAADHRNSAQTGNMKAYIVPPKEMKFLPSRVEAEIGTSLELPLAIYGEVNGKLQPFNDCRLLKYVVKVMDETVFSYSNESLPLQDGSCTTIKVDALKLGHTEVMVTYTAEKVKLSASVTIAAYKPLKPVDPESVAVISVGSSYEVLFEGGPQPWVLDTAKFFQKMEADDTAIMSLRKTRPLQKNLHTFRVLCQALGEQDITVSVGNGITPKNKFPAAATASIRCACAPPVGLHLIPVVKHPAKLPPCPIMPDSPEAIPVPNYQDLVISVSVTDSIGRRFNNFSSLSFDWELTDYDLASFRNNAVMEREVEISYSGMKTVKAFQVVDFKNQLGTLSVIATITKYDSHHFKVANIYFPEAIDPPVTGSLDLMAVDDARITPEFVNIFNHPSNKAELRIQGGSGHFHIDHQQTRLAEVDFNRQTKTVQVVPLRDGVVTIVAHDLCIKPKQEISSQVHISGVNTINLRVVDKVQLDKKIVASVSVTDDMGKPILASYFHQMQLEAKTGSDIIHVSEAKHSDKSDDPHLMNFIIHGKMLGRTNLQFVANTPVGKVFSSGKEIQVFPPLSLDPKNLTLILGAVFQVLAFGGPQPESTIEFTINNTKIAGISGSGVVDALMLGDAEVTGFAVGYEEDTGHKIIYSSDTMTIHVVELKAIRIFAPLKRIQTGKKMPIYAMGQDDHFTPFSFGSSLPPLKFSWTTSNKEAVSLRNIYYESNIAVKPDANFAVQLHAHQAGYTTVGLTVTFTNTRTNKVYHFTDEVQIQIFDELKLMAPEICSGELLMTPDTEAHLRTNRDSAAYMTYKVSSEDGGKPVVSVNEAGEVISNGRYGKALLAVTAHEDFGVNQTVVILVKIKMVSYIMAQADTILRTTSSLPAIPVGTSIRYRITLHDDLGHEFYATNAPITYRLNRYDLVHIQGGRDNNTLIARTNSIGHTVFKVWVKGNSRMADYVNVKVGYAITPAQAQVTLGDIICFSSPVMSASGHSGSWSASSGAVRIRKRNGVAVASGVGMAVVTYDLSGMADAEMTYTEVRVSPAKEIRLLQSSTEFLTDIAIRRRTAMFPVVLLSDDLSRTTNLHGQNCSEIIQGENFKASGIPFDCELTFSPPQRDLDINDLFHVLPTFDVVTGQYQCEITTAELLTELRTQVSTLKAMVNLQARVIQNENQGELLSNTLSMPFLPGYLLHTTEVRLSNQKKQGLIKLSATEGIMDDLQIISSDPTLVEVLSWRQDGQFYTIPVQMHSQADLYEIGSRDVSLEVKSKQLGQKSSIPVKINVIKFASGKPVEELSLWAFFSHFLMFYGPFILCVIFTIICLFMGISWLRGGQFQTASNTSGVFLPPGGGSPPPAYQPNPWTPAYSPSSSSGKIPLWTSGYDLNDSSFQRRSPSRTSPYRS